MLAQFLVENFLSIRDRAVLNLTASNHDNEHLNNIFEYDKLRCLRSAVIYGANASGKSSLLKAMTAAILLVRESQAMQVNSRLLRITPFLLDDDSRSKPSFFEFVIMIEGIRYVYGFSATQEKIIDEYLYAYFTAKRSLIFERSNTSTYKFNKADEREFSAYKEKTTDNKLFLATSTAWNCQKTKPVFMWFADGVDTFTDNELNNPPETLKHFKESDSPQLREFTLRLLSNADINIDSYVVDSHQTDPPPKALMDLFGVEFGAGTIYNVTTGHTMPDNKKFFLDLSAESLGTQNLFFLSPFLFEAFRSGKTLFIDEMSCLHTALVQFLVTLFNDPDFNSKNAQLIFATHDTNLLDLRLFRRDQIYFVEKDAHGNSDLYSLDNFSVRKKENVRLAYLLGRYGAVPNINNGVVL